MVTINKKKKKKKQIDDDGAIISDTKIIGSASVQRGGLNHRIRNSVRSLWEQSLILQSFIECLIPN